MKRKHSAVCTLHAVLALLAACTPQQDRLSVALADSTGGAVVVHGLSVGVARRLSDIPSSDPRWSTILPVRTGAEMPAMAGRYEVVDSMLRFTPRFAPEGVAALEVTLDRDAWREAAGAPVGAGQDLWWKLPLAQPGALASSTRLVAIYPSSPIIPANQLRWYLEFSAPMREGAAKRHVRLVNQDGRADDKAFLDVEEELWDVSRTRLTLMFDMGRVKQGIQSREDLGPVLFAGKRYTLEVDRAWLDARGVALVADTIHRFRAGADRHEAIDPSRWKVGTIAMGTRAPLRIDFGVTLDHALGERLIAITSAEGERVGGTARLVDHDGGLEFVPTAPWGAVEYQLRVHPALEDVAGNRVGHAFDASIAKGESAGVASREVILSIRRQ